ncbi:MAG: hypothetical protein H6611_09700 [Ignavibacteriales bacterium]|nr:hypothetical protein [Ignavibacteriales bacterium]
MMEKIIKVKDDSGNITFKKCRKLKLGLLKNGDYFFKDAEGNRIIPYDEELVQYNLEMKSPQRVENGWLTFIGILTLINLLVQIFLIISLKGN